MDRFCAPARELGAARLREIAHRRLMLMHRADILGMLADAVQPRSFDDFLAYGFDDPPPPPAR